MSTLTVVRWCFHPSLFCFSECDIRADSPWSYMAYAYLRRNREALTEHGVDVDMHPIFLGGINVGSGNKP